jgi:hypothetical protein
MKINKYDVYGWLCVLGIAEVCSTLLGGMAAFSSSGKGYSAFVEIMIWNQIFIFALALVIFLLNRATRLLEKAYEQREG